MSDIKPKFCLKKALPLGLTAILAATASSVLTVNLMQPMDDQQEALVLDRQAVKTIVRETVAEEVSTQSVTNVNITQTTEGQEKEILDRQTVQLIIRETLAEEPEILIKSVENLRKTHLKKQAEKEKEQISQVQEMLEKTSAPWAGSDSKDAVTINYFSDYNCGYCKKQAKVFSDLLSKTDNIKVVYNPFPIFGQASEKAAAATMMAWQKGPAQFLQVHNALISHEGRITDDVVTKALSDVDIDALGANFSGAENAVRANQALGKMLKLEGTPALLINNKLYRGFMDANALTEAIGSVKS
ncbi:hypothetical protein GCM10023116_29470 [Kistimonas scapharcae]|uniref:DSBA-like thioredoxin domain-containing protein n=1 Tax=Kistimonas scapharcae TaxID=1036133 RepID=A0ABP8V3T6_9GAMM